MGAAPLTRHGGILLHACCGPCATVVIPELESMGWTTSVLFHNPNIHPWKERERRLEALRELCEIRDVPLLVDGEYPLEQNLRMLLRAENRCLECFRERLGATAARASMEGFPAFSTTLAVSPYQDHGLMREAGEEAASEHSVRFVYLDLRPRYRESVRVSREMGLYRQPYCGCVMSERDRYLGVKPSGGAADRGG